MKATATSIPACVGGLDVEPIFSSDDVSCVAVTNRHRFCYVSDALPIGRPTSYFKNLLFCKFMNWTVFSAIMSSVQQLIFKVSRPSVIAQIFNVVVQWVPVIVATIHSLWPWPNKSKQNKVMNIKTVALTHNVKIHMFSINLINSRLKYLSGHFLVWGSVFSQSYAINTANLSKVGDFVKALVSGHRFPDFLHVVAPSNAPKCKIHGSQWSDWFSGANLAMSNHYKA